MKQPWKSWTWKQRTTFGAVLGVVSFALLAAQTAAQGSGASLAISVAQIVILPPLLYVIFSSDKHAQRRFKEGDDSAFAPRVARTMREREESGVKPTRGEIHRSWFLWGLIMGALMGVFFTVIYVGFGKGDTEWSVAAVLLVMTFGLFLVGGQGAAVWMVHHERRKEISD